MKSDTRPSARLKILFADDEPSLQELMSLELPRMGHDVTVCPDGTTAVAALEKHTYDCLLVDLDMPGIKGLEVIARARQLGVDTEAVVLTGKSSLESAITALRQGAFDYLTKPCKLIELQALLRRVAAKRELTNQVRALRRRVERVEGETRLVGRGRAMERVRQLIAKVGPTQSTVLILGETGTGKELVAKAVHEQSLRSEKPFVAVNCGALPESLIESELFGHRRGAFTGADEHRAGLFEVAHGGTLFLDEIGELPKSMQAKLLRVLESGEIRRVGDNESFHIDVRVICATHRNLSSMVEAGDFREDLMYRINTFEIVLPPLRDRIEDIPELAEYLCRRFRPVARPGDTLLSADALDLLQGHSWPGNVRELANVIEHATILLDQWPISAADIPQRFGATSSPAGKGRSWAGLSLRDIEMLAISDALERHNGNKPDVAEELGISLKTLYNKLNQQLTNERAA
jgi:two-component system NtrC family response regulator